MITHWLALIITLQGPWGIPLEGAPQLFAESFQPSGDDSRAHWTLKNTRSGSVLEYNCQVRKGCMTHPSQAKFYFSKQSLASAELSFQKEMGPEGDSIPALILGQLQVLGPPMTDTLLLGRRIQYFNRDGVTYVWAQDGPDAQMTIYVDKHDPVGLAEAVSLGATLDLEKYPGALEFSQGQTAVSKEKWSLAIRAFRSVLSNDGATPHLKNQARLVLAMTIAAQVKSESTSRRDTKGWHEGVRKRMNEAIQLAPGMKAQLTELKTDILSSAPVQQTEE